MHAWRDRLVVLAKRFLADLLDRRSAFSRLARVQVLMLAGDTLVTISLAGSLFFSVSPNAAEDKVLFYLVLTILPFAVVSPFLGPLIDASRNARRAMVFLAASGRVVLCLMMAGSLHSLWLFPEAFCVLVLSKLYLVTRGALVPETAEVDRLDHGAPDEFTDDDRPDGATAEGFAGTNARLTLLGTLSGFAISAPGIGLLKLINASAVLVLASCLFGVAAVAALRLRVLPRSRRRALEAQRATAQDSGEPTERYELHPGRDRELILSLTASASVRFAAGFLTFLIAFGLRRHHSSLWWYGFAFAASGAGSLIGLWLVRRARRYLREQTLLALAIATITVGAVVAAMVGDVPAQAGLALVLGIAGAVAQPSFDALTQRHVPVHAQGRIFAKFAVRQQLAWVAGALVPVALPLAFDVGDAMIAVVVGIVCAVYVSSGFASTRLAGPATTSR